MAKVIRVLVAKPGLDGHDRGAKVVARGLRDSGFEVIYTGLHQTPEMVANAAIQEDVDVVGLSILSGAHTPLVKAIHGELKKRKAAKPIFVGGIIPDDDAKQLLKMGVLAVFGPGTSIGDISEKIKKVAGGQVSQKKTGKKATKKKSKKSKKKTTKKKSKKASKKTSKKSTKKKATKKKTQKRNKKRSKARSKK